MIKAKKPDQTRISFRGKIYDKFNELRRKASAEKEAKELRTFDGRVHRYNYTNAIVVDLGKEAGIMRYAVFVAQGKKIQGLL